MLQQLKYGPYSASRLESAKCGYGFYRHYIKKDTPEVHSEPAAKGSAVHLAFETIVQAIIHNRPVPPPEECVKVAELQYELKEDASKEFLREAVRLFHADPTRMFDPKNVVGVEELLAVDADYVPVDYDDPRAILRGKADILIIEGDVATIIDHKNQMSIAAPDSDQMAIYAFLVAYVYPYVRIVRTIVHQSAPELNFYSKPHEWNRDDIEDIRDYTETRIIRAESITAENATAYAGDYCQYCPVLTECPLRAVLAPEGIKTIGPIPDSATALKYMNFYMYAEEVMERLKKYMKDYVSKVGPIIMGNQIAEMREQSSRSYDDMKAVIDVLKAHGQDPEQFLRIDGTALKSLMGNFHTPAPLKQDLERVTYKKPSTRFGVYKIK